MTKHKLTTKLMGQYAEAECRCGWNKFLNQPRGRFRRRESLEYLYREHLKEIKGATND